MPSPDPTTGTLARRLLQIASAEVASTEATALADASRGVHEHRKSVRRARAVLAALRRVVDDADVEPLRAALKEWGGQLGEARDAEVRADLAEEALREASITDGSARRVLVDDERDQYFRLHARLVQLAGTPRAQQRQQLLRVSGLELAVQDPEAPAADAFAHLLRREARRVRRAAKAADQTRTGRHELRKAARRMRYVAEAVREADPALLGKAPKRLAEAGRRVQEALGAERDGVLLLRRLEAARARAAHVQESTAAYDELIALAGERARAGATDVPKALRKIDKVARSLP